MIAVITTALLSILAATDAWLYVNTPYEIRANHWWSWLPGSGFYTRHIYNKKH